MSNITYHGTDRFSADTIVGPPSMVRIDLGRGELGKGFYTGSSLAIAAIWAQTRFKENGAVIEFDIPKDRFVQLKGHMIKKRIFVFDFWRRLIKAGENATHTFGYDFIIAPFATLELSDDQYKFESKKAENELNAAKKKIYKCDY